jgi:hypothetical protein
MQGFERRALAAQGHARGSAMHRPPAGKHLRGGARMEVAWMPSAAVMALANPASRERRRVVRRTAEVPLPTEYDQHPGVNRLAASGYTILSF